ncbi:MAG: LAGLIDADG family homing endonuclease [Candidatus Woesearchaeota archaeon]
MNLNLSKFVPKEILTKSCGKSYSLKIANYGEKVLISNTKDKYKHKWYQRYITIPKRCMGLWYSWPAGKNQNQTNNSGRRYNYLLIPKYLPLDKLTLNALGLLQAEMTKGSLRKSNLSFTNSEPTAIDKIIKFFFSFGLKSQDWSWSIVFNYKLKRDESRLETKEREESSLQYWLKFSLVDSNMNRNKFILYTGNKKYYNMRKTTIQQGSLRIDYSNIILYQLIRNILINIDKILTKNNIKYYLQGLIAGEGSVHPSAYGSVDNINIGVVNKNEQLFYQKCLLNLGINSSLEKNCVKVHNLRNFIKIYQHHLFELHPIREMKFLNSLIKFKQIPKELKEEYASIKKEVNNYVCQMV